MIITGVWTTDQAGEVVFVRFAQPLELEHDCEPGEGETGQETDHGRH